MLLALKGVAVPELATIAVFVPQIPRMGPWRMTKQSGPGEIEILSLGHRKLVDARIVVEITQQAKQVVITSDEP